MMHSSPDEGVDTSAYTLTVADVANLIHKSENTIRRLIRDGDLPAIQVQGERLLEYRLREQDVEEGRARLTIQAPKHSRTRSNAQAFKHLDAHERVSASDEQRALSADVAATNMQRLVESIVAPLADANRRLQEANERLATEKGEIAGELAEVRRRAQDAEQARDALQMRVWALETTTAATERPEPSNGPKMQESLSGTAGQGSDAGDSALWATIAAKAAAVPEAMTQAFEVLEAAQPDDPPRRGLLARLFRQRGAG